MFRRLQMQPCITHMKLGRDHLVDKDNVCHKEAKKNLIVFLMPDFISKVFDAIESTITLLLFLYTIFAKWYSSHFCKGNNDRLGNHLPKGLYFFIFTSLLGPAYPNWTGFLLLLHTNMQLSAWNTLFNSVRSSWNYG